MCACDASVEVEGSSDVAVGCCVPEPASTIAVGLGNAGAGALARGERTAALLAVGVSLAGTSNELVSTAGKRITRGEFVCLDAHGDCNGEANKRMLKCKDRCDSPMTTARETMDAAENFIMVDWKS